jgi:hypothetical protein
MLQTKVVEKSELFYARYLFFVNRAVYEIMRNILVQPSRPQMTIWGIAYHAGYLRLQTRTRNM